MASLADILKAKRQKELALPIQEPPPSEPFPIEIFVRMLLQYQPERPYYDLNLKPVLLLIDWLGPFTKAPKVNKKKGISNWFSLYHVPLIANWTEQDVGDFYALFYKEAIRNDFI